ncbi:MAG: S8 family serine peptidase [Candidatus Eisenbacteria bacterium]
MVDFPYGTVAGPGGTAKNTIVVGASNAIDKSMTWFSSWGPVKDGRVKPDIAAPGCKPSAGLTTTYPPNDYTSSGCGTSYAAPITAGSVGLLKQQFDQLGYSPVKPHTLKAVLIQSAEDHGNAGPDYQFGHGHLEVQDAIDIIIANDLDGDLIRVASVDDSEADTYNMAVPAGVSKMRVTLVWDDYEATLGAAKMLVNDLDLLVQSPGGTWSYAYKLNPASPSAVATTGYNDLDNVEVVEVSSPAEGRWTIRVEGSTVPEGPQEYTLVLPYNDPLSSIRRPDVEPTSYELYPGNPNPFSVLTLIRFDLPEPAPVVLKVYDARGRLVNTLVDEPLKAAGRHIVRWDGTSDEGVAVAPGIYFYRIDTGAYTRTRRVAVIR